MCDKGVVKAQKVSVNPQKVSVKPQSILKETKEKETKEKEIAATPSDFYFPDDYILDLKYKEYLAFRKQIKKPLSQISIKANIESLKKLSKMSAWFIPRSDLPDTAPLPILLLNLLISSYVIPLLMR